MGNDRGGDDVGLDRGVSVARDCGGDSAHGRARELSRDGGGVSTKRIPHY